MDIKTVKPGMILTDPALQVSERGDTFGNPVLDFSDAFKVYGWDPAQGLVKVFQPTPEQLQRCLDDRKERLAAWALAPLVEHDCGLNDDGSKRILTGQQLHDTAKRIWACEPVGVANCCNRRLSAEVACVASYLETHSELYEVPYKDVEYADADAQLLDRVQENAKTGQRGYSLVAMLYIAVQFVARGMGETELHQRFGFAPRERGKSQKLHTWATICRKYRKLNLLQRFTLPRPKPDKGAVLKYQGPTGYLDFTKVTPKQGRTILGRCKLATAMDEIVVAATGHKELDTSATGEQVETFLQILHNGSVNVKRVMGKDTLETLRGTAPEGVMANIFDAIADDDAEKVSAQFDLLTEHEHDQLVLIQELRDIVAEREAEITTLVEKINTLEAAAKKKNGKKG